MVSRGRRWDGRAFPYFGDHRLIILLVRTSFVLSSARRSRWHAYAWGYLQTNAFPRRASWI